MSLGPIRPPGWLLGLSDSARAVTEAWSSALYSPAALATLPRGDGHPVMIIPGFAGSDRYNTPLVLFLRQLGYHAVGWKQGRNLGHTRLNPQSLGDRIAKLNDFEGRKITLIGHSLGGVFAREAAKRHPDRVRQVISLGSPIGPHRGQATGLTTVYKSLNRSPGQADESDWHIAPPVPTTAVYSRFDGVLDWRVCLQCEGHERTENIEVCGSHNGMTLNPRVWTILADRLANPPEHWQPFKVRRYLHWLSRGPAWAAQAPLQSQGSA